MAASAEVHCEQWQSLRARINQPGDVEVSQACRDEGSELGYVVLSPQSGHPAFNAASCCSVGWAARFYIHSEAVVQVQIEQLPLW